MNRAIPCGLVVTMLAGCAPSASPRRDPPAPMTTGAVTSINPTDAEERVPRVEDMLIGRVPGLEVLRLPGGNYTLRIRGSASFLSNEEPLLVIDGTPITSGQLGSTLAGLSPHDVAQIDVLKDAGSTAIWGIRGGNGVIVITTKRAH